MWRDYKQAMRRQINAQILPVERISAAVRKIEIQIKRILRLNEQPLQNTISLYALSSRFFHHLPAHLLSPTHFIFCLRKHCTIAARQVTFRA